jgi:transcriptional regulator with PAS, ATPase and Fis domain
MKEKTVRQTSQKRCKATRSSVSVGLFLISGDNIEIKEIGGKEPTEGRSPAKRFPTLREVEQDYIKKVLSHVKHNRKKAAEILGIARVSLWRKMKQHEGALVSCHEE